MTVTFPPMIGWICEMMGGMNRSSQTDSETVLPRVIVPSKELITVCCIYVMLKICLSWYLLKTLWHPQEPVIGSSFVMRRFMIGLFLAFYGVEMIRELFVLSTLIFD